MVYVRDVDIMYSWDAPTSKWITPFNNASNGSYHIDGGVYALIEVFWKMFNNLFFEGDFSLVGSTSFWMFLVGGIGALLIGKMNENKITYKLPIWIQCFIGTTTVLTLELLSGMFCNIYMGWNLWDYSNNSMNLLGQICLLYGAFWYFLVPFGIWLDDFISYVLFGEERIYNMLEIYKALFTFKTFY